METHVEEEELRESYYVHCRNRGYTIEEASERSLNYIKRVLNADSLTSKWYLEELYQASIAPHDYSSSPLSYDDDPPMHSSRRARDGGSYAASSGFSSMTWSLLDDNDSTFAEMRTQAEEDWSIPSVPKYRAPQYIPSHYDHRNNDREPQWQHAEERSTPSYRRPDYIPSAYDYQNHAQQSRETSDRYTARDHGPQRSFSYGPCSNSYSWSSSNGDRRPPSAYRYWTAESSQPPYSSSPPSYTFYSSSDSYPTNSSYSFRPGAPPRTSYVPPQPPSSSQRPVTPPQPPSSSQRPVTPPPQGIKPATDLYTVLGVGRIVTAADIKKAHRAMSLKWHPDRCRGQDKKKATEKMAEINQANDVLCDEVKRKFYDRWGVLPSEV